ncbi:hypothetical protein G6F46_014546 [Rhizopus delemar]|nr:hypothetical protein G6F46_014546 [Rhizopus delemar]
MASWSWATLTLRCAVSSWARRLSRWATAWSYCERETSCWPTSACRRLASAAACFCCASSPATWLRAACSFEAYRLRCASASIGSSVAMIWPCSTRMPSSIITSRTLPVILAETVAMRRATT